MISDYLAEISVFEGQNGRKPTCDIWGTVLAGSEDTRKGTLRVRAMNMEDGKDTFDNVPVLTGCGGTDYGAFFLPEEGDIVRLTFLGGDFRHPVVTGCRFPEDSRFVQDMCKDDKIKKAFRAKNGSGVFFAGEKGKESIEISGSQNMEWKLDEENQKITFGDKGQKNYMLLDKQKEKAQIVSQSTLRMECGKSSLELKKDGTIVIQCQQLTLDAKNIKIQGKAKVEVKGQELSLDGAVGVSVTGKSQVKVNSRGTLKLSGAMINLN